MIDEQKIGVMVFYDNKPIFGGKIFKDDRLAMCTVMMCGYGGAMLQRFIFKKIELEC